MARQRIQVPSQGGAGATASTRSLPAKDLHVKGLLFLGLMVIFLQIYLGEIHSAAPLDKAALALQTSSSSLSSSSLSLTREQVSEAVTKALEETLQKYQADAKHQQDEIIQLLQQQEKQHQQQLQQQEQRLEQEQHEQSSSSVPTQRPGLPQSAKDAWCPQAHCDVTALCHPCTRRYLVILSTGRSGSTTLNEMIQSLPGIRMSGENNGMLTHFYHAMSATRTHFEWNRGHLVIPGPWRHNPVPPSAFACVTQQMVETINPPLLQDGNQTIVNAQEEKEDIVGFKTIRFPPYYNASIVNETERQAFFQDAAIFLNESLPCARFIISIRDAAAHAKSVQKAFDAGHAAFRSNLDEAIAESTRRNQDMMYFAQLLGNEHRVRVVDSTEWTKDISILNQLVSSWLGFSPACHFQQLFQMNTRRNYYQGKVTSRKKTPAGCSRLPF